MKSHSFLGQKKERLFIRFPKMEIIILHFCPTPRKTGAQQHFSRLAYVRQVKGFRGDIMVLKAAGSKRPDWAQQCFVYEGWGGRRVTIWWSWLVPFISIFQVAWRTYVAHWNMMDYYRTNVMQYDATQSSSFIFFSISSLFLNYDTIFQTLLLKTLLNNDGLPSN